ncbi:MAG: GntR family transcriptional regulator [Chloroflexi bacterium]|nr:GntR family transcriptional regulator [Chloroflexota bacterium]
MASLPDRMLAPGDLSLPPYEPDPALADQSMTLQAYAAIRQAIVDVHIRPGEPIAENTLARWLGMSRTPVREAILRLRQEGWVYSIHRKGLFVSPVSLSDFRELFETLEGLESIVARLVTERATPDDLARLRSIVERQEAATEADDREAWTAASRDFHTALAELAGNHHIADVRARLLDQAGRVSRLTLRLRPRPTEPTAEHRALFEAIAAGDVDRAMLLAHAHRAHMRAEAIALLEQHLPQIVVR